MIPALPMNLGEITETLTDIARNGEGADRIRALKMLQAMHSGGTQIPVPMSDDEVVRDLAVLIRCAGTRNLQLAMKRATGHERTPVTIAFDIAHAPPEIQERARRITSVKKLYAAFPILKGGGVPKGYPMKGSKEDRAKFCQHEALKCYLSQERDKVEAAIKAHDQFIDQHHAAEAGAQEPSDQHEPE